MQVVDDPVRRELAEVPAGRFVKRFSQLGLCDLAGEAGLAVFLGEFPTGKRCRCDDQRRDNDGGEQTTNIPGHGRGPLSLMNLRI